MGKVIEVFPGKDKVRSKNGKNGHQFIRPSDDKIVIVIVTKKKY